MTLFFSVHHDYSNHEILIRKTSILKSTIKDLQEEEQKSESMMKATNMHVAKLLKHLPPTPGQHSLSEILAPQGR